MEWIEYIIFGYAFLIIFLICISVIYVTLAVLGCILERFSFDRATETINQPRYCEFPSYPEANTVESVEYLPEVNRSRSSYRRYGTSARFHNSEYSGNSQSCFSKSSYPCPSSSVSYSASGDKSLPRHNSRSTAVKSVSICASIGSPVPSYRSTSSKCHLATSTGSHNSEYSRGSQSCFSESSYPSTSSASYSASGAKSLPDHKSLSSVAKPVSICASFSKTSEGSNYSIGSTQNCTPTVHAPKPSLVVKLESNSSPKACEAYQSASSKCLSATSTSFQNSEYSGSSQSYFPESSYPSTSSASYSASGAKSLPDHKSLSSVAKPVSFFAPVSKTSEGSSIGPTQNYSDTIHTPKPSPVVKLESSGPLEACDIDKSNSTRKQDNSCTTYSESYSTSLGVKGVFMADSSVNYLDAISTLKKACSDFRVLGFDCEWVSNPRPQPIALLQLATIDGKCFLFRIHKIGFVPSALKELLENSSILKVGMDPFDEAMSLHREYNVEIASLIDVVDLARLLDEGPLGGLGGLTTKFLNVTLDKELYITLSDWEAEVLTERQIKYAANDALACLKIFDILRQRCEPIKRNTKTFINNEKSENRVSYFGFAFESNEQGPKKEVKKKKKKTPPVTAMKDKCTKSLSFYSDCYLLLPNGMCFSTIETERAHKLQVENKAELISERPLTLKLVDDPVKCCVVCGKRKKGSGFRWKYIIPPIFKCHMKGLPVRRAMMCKECFTKSVQQDMMFEEKLGYITALSFPPKTYGFYKWANRVLNHLRRNQVDHKQFDKVFEELWLENFLKMKPEFLLENVLER